MRNIKLTIEYDGTHYNGWQCQKSTSRTLQETTERALERILKKRVRLFASGRTDAGVHALKQAANFKTVSTIPAAKFRQVLNSVLPQDIAIVKSEEVNADFHARFNAKSKVYRYTILNQRYHSARWRNLVYFVPQILDVKLMQKAACFLRGRHDFKSFQAADKKERSTIRTIKKLRIFKEKNLIHIDVEADGFLYKMVRNIIGTLVDVGKKKQPPSYIKQLFVLKSRKHAGPTVPGCGLCLLRVKY